MSDRSVKELLWLSCREKSCCHTTRVILSGRDVWRISKALELPAWQFTVYCEAEDEAVDGFRLVPGGPDHQVLLAKRGAVRQGGAPCVFLWKLADGHAQCGLGALCPLVCNAYPALLVDGVLCADGRACTCRRWSVQDLDEDTDTALLRRALAEAAEYAAVVGEWNRSVDDQGRERTYLDFCAFLMSTYESQPDR